MPIKAENEIKHFQLVIPSFWNILKQWDRQRYKQHFQFEQFSDAAHHVPEKFKIWILTRSFMHNSAENCMESGQKKEYEIYIVLFVIF